MTEPITLSSASLRCDIKPDLGGCITGLWLGDLPVLRSTPASELMSVRLAGSYPLVPFSNRVGHATLKWQGTSHPLVQNNGPEPHAIHGLGWQRPWQVLDQDDQLLMLAFEHSADASWPFAFDASQTFRLSGNTLELTLSMTNQSAMPAPAGLGWHPYFVKRSRSRITFEATGRWEMNEEKLPTHRQPSHGLDGDCTSLDVDHCFDGWNGVVHLHDEKMHTRIASNLGRLVVFTNPQRDFVAIEPVSHVNNAVNLLQAGAGRADELGIQVLAPGESMSAHMSIQVEPAP
ncbi:MAG: aldose 1-epimerase [Polaromonas sp.]|uniref:aldose 1-epimerase n=1 Tax=Polaromonas sp. TaxID=1869339 RepID=UPI0027312B27|nr:aldose 1-epimerase [Polaromonas sp.]MDP2451209.1 aldose 1-epimerase [Polaromonas sp.]MDP3246338.1 aldose 1-epimerase [Polaromonas sp.]MDP3756679.1 aldose 1-epimerase [Polaromonas sp.]